MLATLTILNIDNKCSGHCASNFYFTSIIIYFECPWLTSAFLFHVLKFYTYCKLCMAQCRKGDQLNKLSLSCSSRQQNHWFHCLQNLTVMSTFWTVNVMCNSAFFKIINKNIIWIVVHFLLMEKIILIVFQGKLNGTWNLPRGNSMFSDLGSRREEISFLL